MVVLLRGVNVGGVTVRSAELRSCVEGLGYTGVRTVLASGNVLLDAAGEDLAHTKARVEQGLRETFGYDAWVVVVAQAELARLVEAFPFATRDGRHDYATFVSSPTVLAEIAGEVAGLGLDPRADPVAVGEGVVFWQAAKGGTLDAPFARLVARPRYRPTTTTRNLTTLRKLV